MRDKVEALLERVSSLPDGNAWPSTIELICDMADALEVLADENERMKLQRDEARGQFDTHVAWSSDQQAAAEARAIAAEEAITMALCCTPSIQNGRIVYDCGDPWAILRAALTQKEGE